MALHLFRYNVTNLNGEESSVALRTSSGTSYEISGNIDDPAVVFIHGLGLSHKTWNNIAPCFNDRYRVVLYDLNGHGESDASAQTQTLSLFAEQLADLLDELDIRRAAIIGFSLGGMINRRFALDYPERAGPLAILNSPHERDQEAQSLVEKRAVQTSAGGIEATIDETLKRWFTSSFIEENPKIVSEVRSGVLSNDLSSYTQCRHVLANGVIELIRPDPSISVPTLIMTCENDSGSTPAMANAIGQEIKGSEVVVIPDLKHLGLLEEPELFISSLKNFLDRHWHNLSL